MLLHAGTARTWSNIYLFADELVIDKGQML